MLRLNQNSENTKNRTHGEYVSILRGRHDASDTNFTDSDALADEVKVDLDMLCTLVLDRVDREIDGADVVVVDKSAPGEEGVELLKRPNLSSIPTDMTLDRVLRKVVNCVCEVEYSPYVSDMPSNKVLEKVYNYAPQAL